MAFGKLGQSFTFREVMDLVCDDLQLVEREISLESIAILEAFRKSQNGAIVELASL